MTMTAKGLAKLIEECGELIQIAGKKLACMETDKHWNVSSLSKSLEDEIGDVLAACKFVSGSFNLDKDAIAKRMAYKLDLYLYWDSLEIDLPT